MGISQLQLRPVAPADIEQLDAFRRANWDADIEMPFGYSAPGVETIIAEKGDQIVGALTGIKTVVFDFMKNPGAFNNDLYAAVLMMERALACAAQKGDIAVAYVAVPVHLTEYIDIVKRSGYEEACQNCVILRRPLRKELTPSLADERSNETA